MWVKGPLLSPSASSIRRVTEKARRAHDEWLAADAHASDAENRLKVAWNAYETDGPVPDDSLAADVSRLRAIANDRLTGAVMALRAAIGRKR